MTVENFLAKPGIKDLPHDILPVVAKVAGEIIGYNKEIMDLYGPYPYNSSIVNRIELRRRETKRGKAKFNINVISNGGVNGAGDELMLDGCLEFVSGKVTHTYDTLVAGSLVGEFDFKGITQRHIKFVPNEE